MNPLQALMQLLGGSGGGAPGMPGAAPGGAGAGGGQNLAQILPMLLNLISSMGAGSYGQKQIGQMNNIYGQQQQAANLAMNPTALGNRAANAAAPINKELAYSTTKAADAATAGNGVAQSPGAVASGRAAALAPYAQQNLEMGQSDAQFGFPYQFARTPNDYTSLLKELNQYGQNSTYSLPGGIGGTP